MARKKLFVALVASSFMGGILALGGFMLIQSNPEPIAIPISQDKPNRTTALTSYQLDTTSFVVPEGLNFVTAARKSTPAVVHISTKVSANYNMEQNPLYHFFKDYLDDEVPREKRQRSGSGSGVIVSPDGYIVTNNHVIDGAEEIDVLLNDNRTFKASVVGIDPTTDLAVIKIDQSELIAMKWGNSDLINIGEWVLAVGNPYTFNSTVTAGIVSAKARNIDILRKNANDLSIESFIQTDAAVNPGNSGGALVNLKGELVGINTAIMSPTGSYAGYSFAVPVSLVKKVYIDLVEFGTVQRALLGIRIGDVNAKLAEKENLGVNRGVYIASVGNQSAADLAGLESGDVIIAVNEKSVNNTSELQEQVALNRPGDEVWIKYIRNQKTQEISVILQNSLGTMEVVRAINRITLEGASFEDLSQKELKKLNLKGGIRFKDIGPGKWKNAGIQPGFVITMIDKRAIKNIEELKIYLDTVKGDGILITGYYPNGEKVYYGIAW
tara:strand:+ start:928 stop:2415 length:1488 start_codon:yes stop_codon:yes gene_type:complete